MTAQTTTAGRYRKTGRPFRKAWRPRSSACSARRCMSPVSAAPTRVFTQDVMLRASRPSAVPFRQTGFPLRSTAFCRADIAVSGAAEVPEDFDARFDCTRKEYAWIISVPVHAAGPVPRAVCWYRYNYPLDVRADAGGRTALCRHARFCICGAVRVRRSKARSARSSGVMWTRLMISSVSAYAATAFCTTWFAPFRAPLSYVGGGKLRPDDVADVLASCDREQAGPTLPACGLFMNRLWYDHTGELDRFRLGD